jgi:hypothetical protein
MALNEIDFKINEYIELLANYGESFPKSALTDFLTKQILGFNGFLNFEIKKNINSILLAHLELDELEKINFFLKYLKENCNKKEINILISNYLMDYENELLKKQKDDYLLGKKYIKDIKKKQNKIKVYLNYKEDDISEENILVPRKYIKLEIKNVNNEEHLFIGDEIVVEKSILLTEKDYNELKTRIENSDNLASDIIKYKGIINTFLNEKNISIDNVFLEKRNEYSVEYDLDLKRNIDFVFQKTDIESLKEIDEDIYSLLKKIKKDKEELEFLNNYFKSFENSSSRLDKVFNVSNMLLSNNSFLIKRLQEFIANIIQDSKIDKDLFSIKTKIFSSNENKETNGNKKSIKGMFFLSAKDTINQKVYNYKLEHFLEKGLDFNDVFNIYLDNSGLYKESDEDKNIFELEKQNRIFNILLKSAMEIDFKWKNRKKNEKLLNILNECIKNKKYSKDNMVFEEKNLGKPISIVNNKASIILHKDDESNNMVLILKEKKSNGVFFDDRLLAHIRKYIDEKNGGLLLDKNNNSIELYFNGDNLYFILDAFGVKNKNSFFKLGKLKKDSEIESSLEKDILQIKENIVSAIDIIIKQNKEQIATIKVEKIEKEKQMEIENKKNNLIKRIVNNS